MRGLDQCPILAEMKISPNNIGAYNDRVLFICLYCPLVPRCVEGSRDKQLIKRARRVANDLKSRKEAGEEITVDNLWSLWRSGALSGVHPVRSSA